MPKDAGEPEYDRSCIVGEVLGLVCLCSKRGKKELPSLSGEVSQGYRARETGIS
jgi:hypothetical protein